MTPADSLWRWACPDCYRPIHFRVPMQPSTENGRCVVVIDTHTINLGIRVHLKQHA